MVKKTVVGNFSGRVEIFLKVDFDRIILKAGGFINGRMGASMKENGFAIIYTGREPFIMEEG